METNGSRARIQLALVNGKGYRLPKMIEGVEDPTPTADELTGEMRRLRFVTDRLAEALERCEQAVHASARTELEGRVRSAFAELVALQEDAARALGQAVGARVATKNRWRVRRGIEVAE